MHSRPTDFDESRVDTIATDHSLDHFGAILFRLMLKADDENFKRLKDSFPEWAELCKKYKKGL